MASAPRYGGKHLPITSNDDIDFSEEEEGEQERDDEEPQSEFGTEADDADLAGIPASWPSEDDPRFSKVQRLPVKKAVQIRNKEKVTNTELYVAGDGCLYIRNKDVYDRYELRNLRLTQKNKEKIELLQGRLEEEERDAELRQLRHFVKNRPTQTSETVLSQKRSLSPDPQVETFHKNLSLLEGGEEKRSRTSTEATENEDGGRNSSVQQQRDRPTMTVEQHDELLEKVYEKHAEKHAEIRYQVKQLEQEKDALTKQLASIKEKGIATQVSPENEKKYAAFKANFESLKEKADKLNAKIVDLEKRNLELEKQLAEAKQATANGTASVLTKELEAVKQQNSSLNKRVAELSPLEARFTESTQTIATLKKTAADFDKQKQNLQAEISTRSKDCEKAQKDIANIKADCDKRLLDMTTKLADSVKSAALMKEKLASSEKRAEDLSKKVADGVTARGELEKRVNQLTKTLAEATNDEKKAAEMETLKRKLAETDQSYTEAKRQRIEVDQHSQQLKADLEKKSKVISEFQANLGRLQAAVAESDTSRVKAEKDNKRLEGEIGTLKLALQEKAKLASDLELSQKDVRRLRTERDSLQATVYLHNQHMGHYGNILTEQVSQMMKDAIAAKYNENAEAAMLRAVNEKKAYDAQQARLNAAEPRRHL